MSDLNKPVELDIPEEAFGLIEEAFDLTIDFEQLKAGIRLAIAAELDRLAEEWGPKPLPANVTLAPDSLADRHREQNWTFAVKLRGRAAELRGES